VSIKEKQRVLCETSDNAVAILLISFIGAMLFFLCGGSLDGLMYGQWPPINDHPTNWNSQ
jgi:hypothetical protein